VSEPGPRIAIVGATGLVGQEILGVLAERGVPAASVHGFASSASAGRTVPYGEAQLRIAALDGEALDGHDLVVLAVGASVARQCAARCVADGAVVIDLSGAFDGPDVEMVVPEINLADVTGERAPRVVAVAAGLPGALAAVLKPIDTAAHLRAVSVASYEPVSGVGERGVAELSSQTLNLLNGQSFDPEVFPTQIAFNCIPVLDAVDDEGHARSERALAAVLGRVLTRPDLEVLATRVRVPTFFGVCAAVIVDLSRVLTGAALRVVLREAPGLLVSEDAEECVAALDVVGSDAIHVARVREHPERPGTLALWMAVDNVRRAAAVNAVTVAEALLR
jgi:aspartate-semialdehyde dehydrogenase